MLFLIRWILRSCFALIALCVLCFLCTFGGLYYFGRGLPDHHALEKYNPSVSSTVFLQDGSLLKEFALEKRSFLDIAHIPDMLKNAFLAAEDKNFYLHIGVDPLGIIRSLFNNFVNIGTSKRPQGASTITQQIARIFLIGNNDVKYERKIKEAILAFRIENTLSKQKILELYLNQIYLGAGSYGVVSAAHCYFGKSVNDLSIEECATLAALAKGASHYSPVLHPDRAISRRNWVLKRMLDASFISRDEYEQAVKSELGLCIAQSDNRADYYAEEVRKEVISKCNIGSINKDGLVIRVPLNINLQKAAEQALKEGLEQIDRSYGWRGPIGYITSLDKNTMIAELKKVHCPVGGEGFDLAVLVKDKNKISALLDDGKVYGVSERDISWISSKKPVSIGWVVLCKKVSKNLISIKQIPEVQGAIVAMCPHTGRVLAMHGGYSYAISKFNRVTQAYRQPGSVFKPIVYLTALNSGYSPASVIDGSPISIQVGNSLWEPHNYNDEIVGHVTLRTGIVRSLNTPTVRLAQNIGISNISLMSEKLGIYERAPRLWSIVLGAVETSLLRLVNAYSIIANGGKRVSPVLIDQIQDKTGKTIYRGNVIDTKYIDMIGYESEYPPVFNLGNKQVLDERSTYQLISMLMGSVQSGTSRRANVLNIPLAGKTGTSNDSRDNWFIGFTPNLVVGVLVCFDDMSRSLGKKATGASNALPIFVNFMKLAKLNEKKVPFKVPDGITFKYVNKNTGNKCKMNDEYAILEAFKIEDQVDEIVISAPSVVNSFENSTIKEITGEHSNPLIELY